MSIARLEAPNQCFAAARRQSATLSPRQAPRSKYKLLKVVGYLPVLLNSIRVNQPLDKELLDAMADDAIDGDRAERINLAREHVFQAASLLRPCGGEFARLSWMLEDALMYLAEAVQEEEEEKKRPRTENMTSAENAQTQKEESSEKIANGVLPGE